MFFNGVNKIIIFSIEMFFLIRYKTLVTYQTFNCLIKVRTEFMNKSKEFYNDNEDIAVMMFDINYGYKRYFLLTVGPIKLWNKKDDY